STGARFLRDLDQGDVNAIGRGAAHNPGDDHLPAPAEAATSSCSRTCSENSQSWVLRREIFSGEGDDARRFSPEAFRVKASTRFADSITRRRNLGSRSAVRSRFANALSTYSCWWQIRQRSPPAPTNSTPAPSTSPAFSPPR